MTPKALFGELCPNCGGEIAAERLAAGQPCEQCLPDPAEDPCRALARRGKLRGHAEPCRLRDEIARFSAFFEERLGFPPWSLQLAWAKRVILKRSFAILAPTGVGKTTFGLAMAAYLPFRSYIVVPTRLLVVELSRRLQSISPEKEVLGFTGKKGERERIARGDMDILVTTSMFLQRNPELLEKAFAKDREIFVFVDDVDSLLKASRNVDRVLSLLGFSRDEI
ncbi:TPA: DEAD/DEAH box helicase, partial [Candidatus Micrarchaeota archaeon]|nr:DEAD/DEAH box helicase [Candidatus Micrarchaeota archaeon]